MRGKKPKKGKALKELDQDNLTGSLKQKLDRVLQNTLKARQDAQ
jgi:hypothetical protein